MGPNPLVFLSKIIDNTSELLEQHEAPVKEKIKLCLEKSGINENVDGLEDIMNLPQIPCMDFLRTAKSTNNYPSQEFNIVVSLIYWYECSSAAKVMVLFQLHRNKQDCWEV